MANDIEWRATSIKEAIEGYDVRKMPLTQETVFEYGEAVQALNETLNDTFDLRKSFCDWLGKHFRELFDEDSKTTIHINTNGNELLMRSEKFDEVVFKKLSKLNLEYTVSNAIIDSEMSEQIVGTQILVKLW